MTIFQTGFSEDSNKTALNQIAPPIADMIGWCPLHHLKLFWKNVDFFLHFQTPHPFLKDSACKAGIRKKYFNTKMSNHLHFWTQTSPSFAHAHTYTSRMHLVMVFSCHLFFFLCDWTARVAPDAHGATVVGRAEVRGRGFEGLSHSVSGDISSPSAAHVHAE